VANFNRKKPQPSTTNVSLLHNEGGEKIHLNGTITSQSATLPTQVALHKEETSKSWLSRHFDGFSPEDMDFPSAGGLRSGGAVLPEC